MCGAVGRGQQGGKETGEIREHAGGYCYGNLPLAALLTRQKSSWADVQSATALNAAQSQLCHELGPLDSCLTIWHLELFSPGSSLRVSGQGCFVHLLHSFTPHWGVGRQLLFTHLFGLKP